MFRLYPILPRIWYVRGRLGEAAELLEGAIEAGRLLASPPALAGNLFNRSVVALATGDLDVALATAEEAVELTRDLDDGFVTAWAARLAAVLLETAQPDRAVELLLGRGGGEGLTLIPGGWRVYSLELLTRCWLAVDRRSEAERAAGLAEVTAADVRLPLATAWANRAAAAVALHSGDTARATERALASADAAQEVGAPIESAPRARSRAERSHKPTRTTGPWRSFSAQQQHSTRAARCATAKARSENSGSSATAPTGAREQASPTGRASTR